MAMRYPRRPVWKVGLQDLADELELFITVCHFPAAVHALVGALHEAYVGVEEKRERVAGIGVGPGAGPLDMGDTDEAPHVLCRTTRDLLRWRSKAGGGSARRQVQADYRPISG
jgi:hypothetical protein